MLMVPLGVPRSTPSLTERIQQLETALRELRRQQRAETLAAIADAVHGRTFDAGELLAHAQAPHNTDLRQALADARTPRQVGRLLRTLAADRTGPLRLVKVLRVESGCIWEIVYMPDVDATTDAGV
jgi:hypothetical protein